MVASFVNDPFRIALKTECSGVLVHDKQIRRGRDAQFTLAPPGERSIEEQAYY